MRPQRVSLANMRVGDSFNISLQYVPAKNYPIDLYLLMDLSDSMGDDKENVVRLGSLLANTMSNITTNYKLGFGSFVDKNVEPIRSFSSCRYQSECPYPFKNRMKLNQDSSSFMDAVSSAQIVSGSDVLEGGLEALVQATVCTDQIGWAERARRVILFVTDAISHMAGDGKIVGMYTPNDGQCHLDPEGNYAVQDQDYPSLGQISKMIKENAMNLIFAVTDDVQPIYSILSGKIVGSKVGRLAKDSNNIVELIKNIYQEIRSEVEMKDNASPNLVVRYYTSCAGSLVQENNKCQGIEEGSTVDFTVNIEVKECSSDPTTRKQTLEIRPVGVNEALFIELDLACHCPCELPGNSGFTSNSSNCNYGGNEVCGICDCEALHSGNKCQCSGNVGYSELELQCKPDKSTKETCSGQGSCVCGKCECTPRPNPAEIISGRFCECDNFSCDRSAGKICSGNGECKCGKCVCYSGWIGSACDCWSNDDTCIPLGGGPICSGNGACQCGICKCKPGANGRFCEDCPTCPDRCPEFVPCVQCRVFQKGPLMSSAGQCDRECSYPISAFETVQVEKSNERDCYYEVDNQCRVNFVYGFDETTGEKRIRVQDTLSCPEAVPIVAIGAGLAGALVAVGLLALLLFRVCTYLKDRREYVRFQEEKLKAKWNTEQSPLYQTPLTTTLNPMYGN